MKPFRIIMGCFLAFIFLFFALNAGVVMGQLAWYHNQPGEKGFAGYRDEIQAALKSYDFSLRDHFVNLNGFFEHATGRRLINEVQVLRNGSLLAQLEPSVQETVAEGIGAFGEAMARAGIPFAYVQEPYPLDREKTLLPDGAQDDAHERADEVIGLLAARGVDVLDLRAQLGTTVEDIERNFYRTDHHWNTTGAFAAYGIIADKLQAMTGDNADISAYTDIGSWQATVAEQIFLGSSGRRVGRYVAGLDDVTVLTPRFETHMRCEVPQLEAAYEGGFADAVIRWEALEVNGDYFNSDPYCVYVGNNYALVRHRNEQAPVKRHVLLIKDSYMLPVQAFLSTVFTEVDAVDYRYFGDCSLTEYAYRERPDAVLLCVHPSTFHNAQTANYGSEAVDTLLAGEM